MPDFPLAPMASGEKVYLTDAMIFSSGPLHQEAYACKGTEENVLEAWKVLSHVRGLTAYALQFSDAL